MIINELPAILPMVNTALSVIAMVGGAWLVIRGTTQSFRIRLERYALFAAIVVLTGGALFQLNVLPLEVWSMLGAGGRAVIVIVVVTLLVTPEDSGVSISTSGEKRGKS